MLKSGFSFPRHWACIGTFVLATGVLVAGCGSTGPTLTNNRASSSELISEQERTRDASSDSNSSDAAVSPSTENGQNGTAEPVKVLRVDEVRDQIQEVAQSWYGVPYEWAGESKDGIDCSAFVQRVYQQAFAHRLPRVTETQVQTGSSVPRDDVRPGDLVFFKPENEWNHVGVYLGDGTFAHASSSDGVTRSKMENAYWNRYYWTTRRPLKPSVLPDTLATELVAYRYPDSTAQDAPTGALAGARGEKEAKASDEEKSDSDSPQIASCQNPDIECAESAQSSGRGREAGGSADKATRKGW